MVETIWTKLAAPHAVIETSLRNSSQERNFLLQRLGGEMGSFGLDCRSRDRANQRIWQTCL